METKRLAAKESHTRSILKGVSWRIIATFTTISIAYLITGKLDFALEIGGIEVIAKIMLYYFHERLWQMNLRNILRKNCLKQKKFRFKYTLPTR